MANVPFTTRKSCLAFSKGIDFWKFPPTERGSSLETWPEKAWERKDRKGQVVFSEATELTLHTVNNFPWSQRVESSCVHTEQKASASPHWDSVPEVWGTALCLWLMPRRCLQIYRLNEGYMEKAFHLSDKLPDSITPNETHQCIARLWEIIRPLSKPSINKWEELIIKTLLMCVQFQGVNEVTFKSWANVILAFFLNAWSSKWVFWFPLPFQINPM